MKSEQEIIDRVFTDWYSNWSIEDKKYFREHSYIEFHHGIGRNIRNKFGLWDRPPHEPIIDSRGFDISPEHPDAISSRIIRAVQYRANNEL